MTDAFAVPQSLEAERAVLGSALLDDRAYDLLADLLTADDFFREAHAVAWKTIAEFRTRGASIDTLILAEELQRQGRYEQLGGDDLISELINSVPHAVNAGQYGVIVREKARLRRLLATLMDAVRTASDPPSHQTVDEIASGIESSILDATHDVGRDGLREVRDAAAESIERLRMREEGRRTGIATGYVALDELTDGFQASQLIILAARPGKGKSALALDLASFAALDSNKSVLFCSLEMSARELTDRLLASRAGVPGQAIRDGVGITTDDRIRMGRVLSAIDEVRWAIDDASSRTVAELGALARRRRATHGLDLLVVDYLQLVTAESRKGASRQEQVAEVSRGLKCLAKSMGVPILALSQLNREVEGRADLKPKLSDLRESGAIEQDADMVLLIHRTNNDPGRAELIVAKNRSGPEGLVRLAYQQTYPRFRNPEERPSYANGDEPNYAMF